MLEEKDEETAREDDLRLLDGIRDECYNCSCIATQRLKIVVDIARRQNERLKCLLDENIQLKSIILAEKPDNGNIPGKSVSQSYMETSLVLNNAIVTEECNKDNTHTGSVKTQFKEAERLNIMIRKDLTSSGNNELNMNGETNKYLTYMANRQLGSSKMGNNQKNPATATNLPTEILQLIFKYLSFDDLCNVQNICTTWNLATRDTLVWKYAPLELDNEYNLEKLTNVPYLHTVEGDFYNMEKLFDSLVNNVIDLRKMNCDIPVSKEEVISLEMFQNFLDTLKNLEFICLNSSFPNFFELLQAVSSHPNIKNLILHTGNRNECIPNVKNICEIFRSGFQALRKFCMWSSYRTPLFSELPEICKIKLNQLTDVDFVIHNYVDSEAFKFIYKSKTLESVGITLGVNMEEVLDLDFNSMTALKYLALNYNSNECMKCKTLVFPPNVEHLELECIYSENCSTGIVSKAIDSLPSLRVLEIGLISDSNLDKQLENVKCLPSFHTLCINHCDGLSTTGVETVLMKCAVLRKLNVSYVSFRDQTYECLKNCKYLGDIKFHSCIFNPYKLVISISAMKYLTNVCLEVCTFRNEDGKKVPITEKVINNIIIECKFKEPYAKISFGEYVLYVNDSVN